MPTEKEKEAILKRLDERWLDRANRHYLVDRLNEMSGEEKQAVLKALEAHKANQK